MRYDGLGNRLEMTSYADGVGETIRYQLDNGQPLAAVGTESTSYYLYGRGVIGTKTDNWAYILQDGLGSTRQLATHEGVIAMNVAYTPWGDVLAYYGSGGIDFGYLGGIYDENTGLIYLGSGQYYDPVTGRMLTRGAGQSNPYKPGAFDPAGLLVAPLAMLGLVLGKKKKRGKWDTFIALLVVGVVVGMSVSACTDSTYISESDQVATRAAWPRTAEQTREAWALTVEESLATPYEAPTLTLTLTPTCTPTLIQTPTLTLTVMPSSIPQEYTYLPLPKSIKAPVFYDYPVTPDWRFYYGFGYNNVYLGKNEGLEGGHSGIDLSASDGLEVKWTTRVEASVFCVNCRGAEPSLTVLVEGVEITFGHINVGDYKKERQKIPAGATIGTIHKQTRNGYDNSHLHLEVRIPGTDRCFVNPIYLFGPQQQEILKNTFSEDYVDNPSEVGREWYGKICPW